jgi:DNA-binding MarR family transcriptional regulator
MERAGRRAMHAMSFLQKRGHLSAVAVGRKMFKRVPRMTPARFDLLHVIRDNMRTCVLAAGDGMIAQSTLTERLGLAKQTVSKMLKRLYELGLIDKYRCSGDKRRLLIGLTEDGMVLLERAYGVAFTERYPAPPQDDGSPPPRHAYRLARDEALSDKFVADMMAAVERKWGPNRLALPPGDLWYVPPPLAPPKVGREVARVYTRLAWKRAGGANLQRRLDALDAMLLEQYTIARALGDTSALIYPVPLPLDPNKRKKALARRRRAQELSRSLPKMRSISIAGVTSSCA